MVSAVAAVPGVYGARMTGAGFGAPQPLGARVWACGRCAGGCIVALLEPAAVAGATKAAVGVLPAATCLVTRAAARARVVSGSLTAPPASGGGDRARRRAGMLGIAVALMLLSRSRW